MIQREVSYLNAASRGASAADKHIREENQKLDKWICKECPDEPIMVLRPSIIAERVSIIQQALNADILYAVKCNPEPAVIKSLFAAGIRHFDTASLSEIELISVLDLSAECYFHHPIKSRSSIREAAQRYGVRHFTVDCRDELEKVAETVASRKIAVHVRIAVRQNRNSCGFSGKFGAAPEEAVRLLNDAVERGFRVGVSFHVGSQCQDPLLFATALADVTSVIRAAHADIEWINCGGGFPVATMPQAPVPPLTAFLSVLVEHLQPLRRETGATILLEPGRVLVAEAQSLVVQVHQRRRNKLYINDGIYGALSNGCCGCRRRFAVRKIGAQESARTEFTIFGPTCDAEDKLADAWVLPVDIREGDWIEVATMGAYAGALTTRFNGLHRHRLAIDGPGHGFRWADDPGLSQRTGDSSNS